MQLAEYSSSQKRRSNSPSRTRSRYSRARTLFDRAVDPDDPEPVAMPSSNAPTRARPSSIGWQVREACPRTPRLGTVVLLSSKESQLFHPAAARGHPTSSARPWWMGALIGTPKGRNEFFRIRKEARTSDDW